MTGCFRRTNVVERVKILGIAVIAVCLCLQAVDPNLVAARTGGNAVKVDTLPLWRALPKTVRNESLKLGREVNGNSIWEGFAYRVHPADGSERVCVEIVSARLRHRSLSVQTSSPECGPVGPGIESPVIAEAGLANPGRTVVVAVTGTKAVKAKLVVEGRPDQAGKFHTAGASRAKKARLEPFRYAALVARPNVCVDQVIGDGSGGSTEFETPKGRCSDDGS
jgi:hypothetical protein